MENKTGQPESLRLSGKTGRGWSLYKQNRLSQPQDSILRPDHMAGSYNVQIETLGLDTECYFVPASTTQRPANIAGRFAVPAEQKQENPASAGFFHVQETNMLRKVEPIKLHTPDTLQRKRAEIEQKMQDEQQRSREAMANLFLAGPNAWPDSSFDVECDDDDYEEWVPLNS